MTNQAPDPFAQLDHAEIMRARMTPLRLREMGGVLIRTAETIMTMDEGDPRGLYAQEYVARMLSNLERYEETDALERSVDPGRPEARIPLFGLYVEASAIMRQAYGATDPHSAVDVERGQYNPEIARLSDAGMAAADTVLTREIIGFTDPTRR